MEEPKSKKLKTSTLELEEELVDGGEKELKILEENQEEVYSSWRRVRDWEGAFFYSTYFIKEENINCWPNDRGS